MDKIRKKDNIKYFYSFIIDPFLLVGIGFLLAHLTIKLFKTRKRTTFFLYGITIVIFWLVAGALYFDYLNMPLLGEYGRGNHFMWNSGIELLGLDPLVDTTIPTYTDFKNPVNILAMGIFLTYPLFLVFGILIGRGRYKKSCFK